SFDTSPLTNFACPPARAISPATRSPPSALRALTMTFAPSCAKRFPMPSPNPDPPPVTIATLSFSLILAPRFAFAWFKKTGSRSGSLTPGFTPLGSGAGRAHAHRPFLLVGNGLALLAADTAQIHAVTHGGHFGEDRYRDLRRCL